jgi:trimeric autotransporter adhesin
MKRTTNTLLARSFFTALFALCAHLAPAQNWNILGNAGTNPSVHFVGTTDNQPLSFRVNNQPAGQINPLVFNTSFGHWANGSVTTGQGNTAFGYSVLRSNTTGSANSAFGVNALYSNTTGYWNTAFGSGAMTFNSTGHDNVGIGVNSLFYNTTGNNNAALGSYALLSNTSGSNNVALGHHALELNTAGFENTAIGAFALAKSNSVWNTAVGHNALGNSTVASANTAVGDLALVANINGSTNTAIGEDALRRNTTGAGNTALGENALNYNVTGSNNTGLGRGTSIVNHGNATAIGYLAAATASNKIRLGNTSITSLESQVNLSVTSDGRFKKNFRDDVGGLDFILRLHPVTYNYDAQALNECYGIPARLRADAAEGGKDQGVEKELAALEASARAASLVRHTGFVAQEVEEAAAECGFDFTGVVKPQNEHDPYALRYAEFTVPLVKAVQEQHAIVEAQSRQIADLQAVVNKMLAAASESRSAQNPIALSQMALAPNPTQGRSNLEITLREAAEVYISVFDAAGKIAAAQSLGTCPRGSSHHALDLQKLPSGTYFVQAILDGQPVAKQILKQ